jgi:phosphoribosylformylglycinamidine synthase
MYIDGNLKGPYGETRKVSGLPTLLFTISSVIEDVRTCLTMDAKEPGDLIYILGTTGDELGAGEFYQMMGTVGLNVPTVDTATLFPMYMALHKAIKNGLVASAHTILRGGLGIHAALVAMAGERGLDMDLEKLPVSGSLSNVRRLYSESVGRFIVTVAPARRAAFEESLAGFPLENVGEVTDQTQFIVRSGDRILIDEPIRDLKARWTEPFGGLV